MDVSTQLIRVLRRNLTLALKRGQLIDAERLLGQLKLEDPVSLETRGLELEYLIAIERRSDAREMAEQLLHLYPDSARIQYLAGRIHYRDKAYTPALHCFTESNRLHGHYRTRRWIGKTLTQTGQFAEAEGILLTLEESHPVVQLDLAWLYERMEHPHRALQYVESYLRKQPDDDFASQQKLRLNSILMEPKSLVNDIDTLLDLDENVPREMLPAYIQNLLTTGNGHLAREFLNGYKHNLDTTSATSIAWICHKLLAYDLAMDLFVHALRDRLWDIKFLSALESAARHCNRIPELIEIYEPLADSERRLYGRMQRLRKIPMDGG